MGLHVGRLGGVVGEAKRFFSAHSRWSLDAVFRHAVALQLKGEGYMRSLALPMRLHDAAP